MASDRLNKLRSGNNPSYKYENPYASGNKPESKPKADNSAPVDKEKSILQTHGHLYGKMKILQDEIDNLKFDIVTLLTLIEDDDESKMTMRAIREKYSKFRGGNNHIMNRIPDKTQSVINNDITFND